MFIQRFEPNKILMVPETGRVYHPGEETEMFSASSVTIIYYSQGLLCVEEWV